ncbi:hypothetical protein AB0M46_09095 [Dactylosporangium sp. NPDC051485]|uniref:hypothetical protein n=1 Tax=Dactylosporangium sp. NPDC051485 TaxID=3154846 RepID=UPI003420D74C
MNSPGRGSGLSTTAKVLLALLAILLLCCASCCTQRPDFVWALFRDSREYPNQEGRLRVTIGGGDLEKDILPHYRLTLPCDVTDLRFADEEDFSRAGTVYLRFSTSSSCLDKFLRDNGMLYSSKDQCYMGHGTDHYGWGISGDNDCYFRDSSDYDHPLLSASVDRTPSRPIVYFVASR